MSHSWLWPSGTDRVLTSPGSISQPQRWHSIKTDSSIFELLQGRELKQKG